MVSYDGVACCDKLWVTEKEREWQGTVVHRKNKYRQTNNRISSRFLESLFFAKANEENRCKSYKKKKGRRRKDLIIVGKKHKKRRNHGRATEREKETLRERRKG